MTGQRKKLQKKHGSAQSLVEFALLLPILVFLVLGALDIGLLIKTKIVVTNAAREGANYLSRTALFKPTVYDLTTRISETNAIIQEEGSSSNVTIELDEITILGCCTKGAPVTVTITKQEELIFGNILQAFGLPSGEVEVSSSVEMKVK